MPPQLDPLDITAGFLGSRGFEQGGKSNPLGIEIGKLD
jgi:hypothetical protein